MLQNLVIKHAKSKRCPVLNVMCKCFKALSKHEVITPQISSMSKASIVIPFTQKRKTRPAEVHRTTTGHVLSQCQKQMTHNTEQESHIASRTGGVPTDLKAW